MKLTRTTWIFLVAILALVAASASLYMVNSGKTNQQEKLRDDLDQAEASYSQLISQRADLENRLTQANEDLDAAEAALDEAEAKFPPSAKITIGYDEILFGMAGHCQLEITSLVASAPTQVKGGYVTYMSTTFNVVVTPAAPLPATDDESVDRILHFVHTMATGEGIVNASTFVNTTTIESVAMSNTGASITMNIHSYPG